MKKLVQEGDKVSTGEILLIFKNDKGEYRWKCHWVWCWGLRRLVQVSLLLMFIKEKVSTGENIVDV